MHKKFFLFVLFFYVFSVELLANRIPCDQCGAEFTQRSSLRTHIRSVHEGETHSCDQCSTTFTDRSSLNTHIRSVHEGEIHSCGQCGYEFTRRSSLNRHMRYVHKHNRDDEPICENFRESSYNQIPMHQDLRGSSYNQIPVHQDDSIDRETQEPRYKKIRISDLLN